jgi:hypothetical protein
VARVQGEKGGGGRDGEHGRKGDTGQKGERGYIGEKGDKGTLVSYFIVICWLFMDLWHIQRDSITIDLFKGLKKIVSIGNLFDSASRGVVFRLRISPRIRS